MKQIKIAFAGQMRSGKDTCGEYVLDKYGGVGKKFATPLYDILSYAQKRCRLPQEKNRLFLQWVGTNWARETINQNIWVNILIEEVREMGPMSNIVVTDARFKNEFEALQKEGFLLVKIERPNEARNSAEGGITESMGAHASELDVLTYEGFDQILRNTGSVQNLFDAVDKLIFDNFA